jgi:alcohol dehydrogenase (cytochrome c)
LRRQHRGVALWKDQVISVALDGRIMALNRTTGEQLWERKVAEPGLGETVTAAPLVIRDVAIIGSAGGEFGIRGWIDATDLNTGKQAWRTYTIPGKGEPGNETWKDGKDDWMHGGVSVWVTATYDKDTDTIYQGIGNAGPDYDAEYRPGENKWAASVLALDQLIQLSVVKENEAARRLYAGLGFLDYGIELHALKQGGRYYDEILMAKQLR